MTNKIIFLGRLSFNNTPCAGEVRKNQILLERLTSLPNVNVTPIDTINCVGRFRKIRYIIIFVKIIWLSFLGHKKIIVSTHNQVAYRILWMLSKTRLKLDTFYWVIGGSIHREIENKQLDLKVFKFINKIIVEDIDIKKGIESFGINNVVVVPNFKPILSIEKTPHNNPYKKFVYVSRITSLKGCDIIISASRFLNQKKLPFSIDFYGPIEDGYPFEEYIENVGNVYYKGFLSLKNKEDYEFLNTYDVLLFPTFYPNEGFPGTIIDSFMSGLPIITTDWRFNRHVVTEGKTGWLLPIQDAFSLEEKMEEIILDRIDLKTMSYNCFEEARRYDTKNVLNDDFFKTIRII